MNFSGGYTFITHGITDARFNIASEEYLLEHTCENVIYLWRNKKAVIVGSGQNTLNEVDLTYTSDNGIQVVRRISGGGAVFHDLGNICFSVIGARSSMDEDIEAFTRPVVEFLRGLGINAEFSGRNDITVEGAKVSGMAQCVRGDRIMHHGTLLFDADLSVLSKALIPSPLKLKAKGVKSVRKRVANLSTFLKNSMTADEFFNLLRAHLSNGLTCRDLTAEEIKNINALVASKFATYEWNVGKSPVGEFKKSARLSFGTVELSFNLREAVLSDVKLFGDYFPIGEGSVENMLSGVRPVREELISALSGVENIIRGATPAEITDKLFFGE